MVLQNSAKPVETKPDDDVDGADGADGAASAEGAADDASSTEGAADDVASMMTMVLIQQILKLLLYLKHLLFCL